MYQNLLQIPISSSFVRSLMLCHPHFLQDIKYCTTIFVYFFTLKCIVKISSRFLLYKYLTTPSSRLMNTHVSHKCIPHTLVTKHFDWSILCHVTCNNIQCHPVLNLKVRLQWDIASLSEAPMWHCTPLNLTLKKKMSSKIFKNALTNLFPLFFSQIMFFYIYFQTIFY